MNRQKFTTLNVKRLESTTLIPYALPPPLYIDYSLALPSKCEDSHKDGLGEGFEQRPVKTQDGDLYVSLWQSGGEYFMKPEQEFKQIFPEQEQTMQMGM